MKQPDPLVIAGTPVEPGSTTTITVPIPQLYTHTPMEMPVHVIRGKRPGPRLFVCAAIHGDELNGVEIIRRLIHKSRFRNLRGTLIAIPIVNVYGVIHHSRYLPDRRDLNRSFPGTDKGSLASRLANLLIRECVENSTHAIDLHTGAIHRSNLPQIRGDLDSPETVRMAEAFGAPVVIDSRIRDGSLRAAADELGIPIVIYEAGEALRFDEQSIVAGVRGIRNVMRELGMLAAARSRKTAIRPLAVSASSWSRAPISGIFHTRIRLGEIVDYEGLLGSIADPFGETEVEIRSKHRGMVIGRTHLPLVNEGDAVIHIARTDAVEEAADAFADFIED
jgi:predicted deacylase